jgi:hypothetical protein
MVHGESNVKLTKSSFLKAINWLFHLGHNPSTGFAENWDSHWNLSGNSNLKTLIHNKFQFIKWIKSLHNNNNNNNSKSNSHNK